MSDAHSQWSKGVRCWFCRKVRATLWEMRHLYALQDEEIHSFVEVWFCEHMSDYLLMADPDSVWVSDVKGDQRIRTAPAAGRRDVVHGSDGGPRLEEVSRSASTVYPSPVPRLPMTVILFREACVVAEEP